MVSRRQMIAGTFVAGAASLEVVGARSAPLRAARDATGSPPSVSDVVQDNSAALSDILSELHSLRTEPKPGAGEIELIRQARRTYLKTTGKFPEYLDVGIDIWERVVDWYVATRQTVDVGRLPDGHYFVRYVGTNIVLRQELPEGYVGQGSEIASRP
jgi:hypothetical protein